MPTHIDEGMLDLVLADVPDVVGIRVGSPVGASDHSAIFMDVVLEQPIPHLVCRQRIYIKNSVDWKLAKENVKGFNKNEIIRSHCPASSASEALLRVIIRDKVSSGQLWS